MTIPKQLAQAFHFNDLKTLEQLCHHLKEKRVSKGYHIKTNNTQDSELRILKEGIIRYYYYNAKGQEVTDGLCEGFGHIIMTQSPVSVCTNLTECNIECLTDVSYFYIPLSVFMDLMNKNPPLTQLFIRVLSDYLDIHVTIRRVMQSFSPTERYEWFVKTYPTIHDKIAKQYIASFLGMTPVSLSRIRSKLKNQTEDETDTDLSNDLP